MHPVTPAGVLVGRADELTLLGGLLRDLARGSGNAVLIEGEPGIGKTALVRAALAAVPTGGCQVFWGAGDELGQELPLLPFLDAFGVRAPSLNARRVTIAALLRGEVSTDRGADVPAILAEQLIALTIDETGARPVALIIDDLQWADPASVKLWGRLARTARDVPLLLLGLTRPVPQREDLLALRRGIDERARIQLTALGKFEVAELLMALAGGSPDPGLLRLADGAAGNPLYLTELMAALGRSGGITVTPSGTARLAAVTVPDSLPAAIADRLGFVSAPTRDVLRAAALLGVEFAVSDLTTVLGTTVAALVPALDEARATGVLTDGGVAGGLAFRHPLIRDALYAELPAAVRGEWHRDAGHALAAAGARPDRVARQLLHAMSDGLGAGEQHLASAGSPAFPLGHAFPVAPVITAASVEIERPPIDPGATWSAAAQMDQWMLDWLAGSADSLVGQAPGVAAELLAQAVAGLPAGSVRHSWLAGRLADALYRTGDRAEAERVAERALGYADDPDLVVDLHWTLAQCRIAAGSARESIAALDRALDAPGITPKHRGRLLVLAARAYLVIGDVESSGRPATSALAAASEAGDAWSTGWALHVLGLRAASRGDLSEALPLWDRALAVTETDPALNDLGLLLQTNKSIMLLSLDRRDEAVATAERARRLADQVGTAVRLAQAHGALAQTLYGIGRWDEALAEITVVPEGLKDPIMACTDLGIAAWINFHRNEPGTARRQLADAEPHAERVGQRSVPSLVLARSLEREQAGAPAEALQILTAAFDDNPDDLGEIEDLLPDAVRLAVAIADKVTAQALAGRAATLAKGSTIPHRQATALYCRGMVDHDASVLLAAAQRYADARHLLPQASALEAAAGVLVEADNRTGARLAFEQAVEIYEFLAAETDLNRIQAGFRAHGIRRGPHSKHRRATSGWDSLTDTELKVVAFVEEGLSNPEIAARLMLSRRTVATHVSHILKKLGVTTRTDIARESALRATAPESQRAGR
jgi:DNA-binding CsgD family transcriptional regulator/tetratricopeptide (TPR) repeat protein